VITLAVNADQILAVPDELLDNAIKCTSNATRLLEIFGDLDKYSETLSKCLTDGAKTAFEELWLNWSEQLLGMAGYLEAVGVSLNNAAVLYLSQDLECAKAFGADPDMAKEIQKEIYEIKKQNEQFKKDFEEDLTKIDELKKQLEEDKKVDEVVDVNEYGDKIYESKEFPGDRYMKRDDGGKIWLGDAKFRHEDDPADGNFVDDIIKDVYGDDPQAVKDINYQA
jgi:uncharacterized protein YukE